MDKALQVRDILSTRGLNLYKFLDSPLESLAFFGFYVPHHLYYDLARTLSLPRSTRCWLESYHGLSTVDWLAVFGFDLDVSPGCSCCFSDSRQLFWIRPSMTGCLDSVACRKTCSQYCSFDRSVGTPLAWAAPRRAKDVLALNKREFLCQGWRT